MADWLEMVEFTSGMIGLFETLCLSWTVGIAGLLLFDISADRNTIESDTP